VADNERVIGHDKERDKTSPAVVYVRLVRLSRVHCIHALYMYIFILHNGSNTYKAFLHVVDKLCNYTTNSGASAGESESLFKLFVCINNVF